MAAKKPEIGRFTQAQVAAFAGVTPRTVRNWDLPIVKGEGAGAGYYHGPAIKEFWERSAYERGFADGKAAGPDFADDDGAPIDVELEKARKLKAERIGQEIKNAQALGDLAPVDMLTSALGDVIGHLNSHLESVPASIKRVWPECPGHVLESIEREIAKLRGTIADARIDFTDPAMGGGWSDGSGTSSEGDGTGPGGPAANRK